MSEYAREAGVNVQSDGMPSVRIDFIAGPRSEYDVPATVHKLQEQAPGSIGKAGRVVSALYSLGRIMEPVDGPDFTVLRADDSAEGIPGLMTGVILHRPGRLRDGLPEQATRWMGPANSAALYELAATALIAQSPKSQ